MTFDETQGRNAALENGQSYERQTSEPIQLFARCLSFFLGRHDGEKLGSMCFGNSIYLEDEM